jgi:hypothetical protein
LLRHGLQPQALDRLLGTCVLHDVAENQFAFAACVASIDQAGHVLALHQAQQHVQAILALLDRHQIEMRRNHRQVCERPLALLDVVFFRHREGEEVADRRRKDKVLAFEVVAFAREAAKGARDVGGDRRLLSDDEFFSHAARKAADDKCKRAPRSTRGRRNTSPGVPPSACEGASWAAGPAG